MDKIRRTRTYRYLISRLGEASTIQGLAAILVMGGGITLSDATMGHISAAAVVVSGLLKVALPDSWGGDPE